MTPELLTVDDGGRLAPRMAQISYALLLPLSQCYLLDCLGGPARSQRDRGTHSTGTALSHSLSVIKLHHSCCILLHTYMHSVHPFIEAIGERKGEKQTFVSSIQWAK